MPPLPGIDLPIIQAPMAGVQGSALAIAVSNAGGVGSLPCAMLGMDAMRQEMANIRAQTNRPFNANFFCHTPAPADPEQEHTWLALFARYYAELGLDMAALRPGAARMPFDAAMADLVGEFQPGVVSFHFGLPSPELLTKVRQSGAKILSSATTVAEARWLESHGVDAIIAQGLEAGGHRGMFLSDDIHTQVGTFALLPQVVSAVKVPVIAAGGIATAQGVKAALGMGASAVQIGTAFLLCPECTTSPVHRLALQGNGAQKTVLTNVFTGRPARGIVNRLVQELGPMNTQAPAFPMASAASLALRQKAESQGSADFSPLWAGQNVSGCKELPAQLLLQELAGLR